MTKSAKLLALAAVALVALPVAGAQAHVDHGNMVETYDTDKNGTVSGDEFKTVYKKDDAEAVFKKLDVNSDGQLSKDELSKFDAKAAAASANTAAPATTPAAPK